MSQETEAGDVWMCQVTANDGFDESDTLNSTGVEVKWAIEFNIYSGETGANLTNVNVNCNNSWSGTIDSYDVVGFTTGDY